VARRWRQSGGFGNLAVYLVAIVVAGVNLAPVAYVIVGGFKTSAQINADPIGLPSPWSPGNFGRVLTASSFWQQLLNSAVIGLATTVGVVMLGVMVAFALSRYRFRLRGAMYLAFTAGLMFPMTVAILPLYLMLQRLGLTGGPLGVIIPQVAFGLPTTVIILVPFLRAIPIELEEAATIDGTSKLGFFRRILLPLAVPGLVTVAVLTFVGSWNAYLLPLFVLNDPSQYTLPLGVQDFSTGHASDTAMVLAFTSLAMLPAICFFSLMEKRIVSGLTGAVKG
jgi:raffinose/stachyose/melibiose transport system permease protein